jgi:dienelactone hydrolase
VLGRSIVMNKIITVIILTVILLSLAGCSDKKVSDVSGDGNDLINTDIREANNNNDIASEDNQNINQENTDISVNNKVNEDSLDEEISIQDDTDFLSNDTSITSNANSKSTDEKVDDVSNTSETDKNNDSSKNDSTNNDSTNNGNELININTDNNNKENNNSKDDINKDDKSVKESIEEQKLSELGELSKKLALQMSKGEFKATHDTLSPLVKLQISLDVLKKGWDDTVADMGDYKDIRTITEKSVENNTVVVYIILNYDNSGIQVMFSYNTNKMLDGLWVSFAPYDSVVDNDTYEEIAISFGDRKDPIEGIFTLPKNVKNPPLVILVHGSGNHDADETIGNNKPFSDLAHGFASHGIAVIRYKESISPKAMIEFTIQDDSLDDAAWAIKYAHGCGKVDTDNIYIVGHSLGGMLAPKIAADNKEVDGIVILAGSPRRLEDIILDQSRILLKEDKSITEAMYKVYMAQTYGEVNKVKNIKESSSEIILGFPASYWYSLNQIDTPKIAKDLDIPILIAQGNADFQVYADIDYVAWQELLSDKENVSFNLYDNLNHLFMKTNGRMDVTEYNIKGTVARKVIDDIAKWILKK